MKQNPASLYSRISEDISKAIDRPKKDYVGVLDGIPTIFLLNTRKYRT